MIVRGADLRDGRIQRLAGALNGAFEEEDGGVFERSRHGCRSTASPQGAPSWWLVNFIQLDLGSLTPSAWMIIAYEVTSFAEGAGRDKHSWRIASASGWSVQALPRERLVYTLPSRKEARQLQRTIRGDVEHLWQHALAPIKFPALTLLATAPGAFDDRHGSLLVLIKPKTKEFEYRVAVLPAHHAGRVRSCQECHRIFVAARSDQLFCDPRCQMRVASRKWRKVNKKTMRKEHR